MAQENKLILVDGSSYMFRSFYAPKKEFSTQDGTPSGALLIFTKMMQVLVKHYGQEKIVVVFDAKGKSFRNDMYAEYKATRPPLPEDMRVQIEPIHTLVKLMGMPLVIVPGVEADDVLGSYAKEGERLGYNVIICTSDKDMAQLVNENVVLHDTMHNKIYDRNGVIGKYGVPPEHIIDFLALKGDTSDNIPGMKGCGDVTAAELINNLGGIFDIKERADEIAGVGFRGSKTFKDKFLNAWDAIELSYRLATIKTDVELPIKIEDINPPVEDNEGLIALFDRYEFATLSRAQRNKMFGDNPAAADNGEDDVLSPQATSSFKKQQRAKTQREALKKHAANSQVSAAMSDLLSIVDSAEGADESSSGEGNSLLNQIKESSHHISYSSIENIKDGITIVDNEDALAKLAQDLDNTNEVAFYVESNDAPSVADRKIVGIALALNEETSYYIPLNHALMSLMPQLPLSTVANALMPKLNRDGLLKIAHDIKQLRLFLTFNDFELQGPFADPQIAQHVINSSYDNDLKFMIERYLKYHLIERTMLLEKKDECFDLSDITEASHYCCERAIGTLRVNKYLQEKLKQLDELKPKVDALLPTIAPHLKALVEHSNGVDLNPLSTAVYADEMQVLDVLYEMERAGTFIDGAVLKEQADDMNEALFVVENEIHDLAGHAFNISSPKQLGKVLFDELNIPYPKAPRDGSKPSSYSTAEEILSELTDDYEIVAKVQRYRGLSKLISTYANKLPNLISAKTGRIHTRFNLAGTMTGRLSSSEPNLQNIPVRSKEGRQIRCAFVAPAGYKIVSVDYSQIELRIIAHYSMEANLIKAFNQHQDIHRVTAAEVLGKDPKDITDDERAHAKATNFGLMYGMSAHGLTRQTKMPFDRAKAYIETYFERYPSIKGLMDSIIEEGKQTGYVTTVLGRHIFIKGIQSSGKTLAGAERAAINAPMQGSAADIIKKAMVALNEYIKTLEKDAVRMTLQIHDELIFEIREDLVESVSAEIKRIMENAVTLTVPLEVGVGVGESWAAAH